MTEGIRIRTNAAPRIYSALIAAGFSWRMVTLFTPIGSMGLRSRGNSFAAKVMEYFSFLFGNILSSLPKISFHVKSMEAVKNKI